MNPIDDNMIYEPHPLSDVELLSCAKNDVGEAEKKIRSLPYEYWIMLPHARELIDKVQEYLYNH